MALSLGVDVILCSLYPDIVRFNLYPENDRFVPFTQLHKVTVVLVAVAAAALQWSSFSWLVGWGKELKDTGQTSCLFHSSSCFPPQCLYCKQGFLCSLALPLIFLMDN